MSAFSKEILRSLKDAPGRFVALFCIVALGVGFYAGLLMTGPDMQRASDAFFDEGRLMDIRVVSSLGMSESDLEEISKLEGVEAVMGSKEADVVAELDEEQYVIRLHSLPKGEEDDSDGGFAAEDEQDFLNQPTLASGRWPETDGECVLSADRIMNKPLQTGEKLHLMQGTSDLDDVMAVRELEVVGLVHSSYYASTTNMGTTSLGSGRVQQYGYVLEGAFSEDYPITEAFVAVKGARDMSSSGAEYEEAVSNVMSSIEAIAKEREEARFAELKGDAQKELDDARAEYLSERADAESQLNDAWTELQDGLSEIEANERKVADARSDYESGTSELSSKESSAKAELDAAKQQLASGRAQLEEGMRQLEEQEAQYQAAVASGAVPSDQLAAMRAQLDAFQQTLADKEAELAAGEAQLSSQELSASSQIEQGRAQLSSAKGQIESGESQLQDARAQYEDGLAEYERSQAEAQEKFADAEADLAKAQADIDAIEMPEWLVMDRAKNFGAESFSKDSERIGSIAQVFPLIFFLVAALVALTTMTRMVEEERMAIGTHKALGYSRLKISSKYMIYALMASLGGSIVGIAALSFLLPYIIMIAYSIVYIVPIQALAIDWPIAIGATALGVSITLLSTLAASLTTLRESPAALMLPPAPKAGKRIFLERIHPLWRRLSFLWKVTCRNLFRYKKRMVMTVIGIAGCTALLLTGFGLHNSINDIIDVHFGQIIKYNAEISFEDDANDEVAQEVDSLLESAQLSGDPTFSVSENVVALGGASDHVVPLVVIADPKDYERYHAFRDRSTHEPLYISDDGVLITEKLGKLCGVGAGEELEIAVPDDLGNPTNETYRLNVTGLVENYVNNAIYADEAYYQKVFGRDANYFLETLPYNKMYLEVGLEGDERSELAKSITAIDGVKTLSYNDETIDSYRTSLDSVNMIVYVLIGAAALLAFVVLYNLTNINISERAREIATLKVLGFLPREVQRYIFREIYILSIIGALVGMVLGVYLEGFVVETAEIDEAMFGRAIHLSSFLIAFVLTLAFTWLVTLFMRGKLNSVNMVESLKSNE